MKQPRGLYVCFLGELWDRFTYYGLQSILVLYLMNAFLFSVSRSYAMFGVFTTLSFCTPILGGLLIDKFITRHRSIIIGCSLIILGCLCLIVHKSIYLYPGLTLIVSGIGLFKPSNATLLGSLYSIENEPLRESGFTILYLGMNAGSVLGPIIYGLIALKFGLVWGLIVSSIGIGTSLFLYMYYKNLLEVQNINVSTTLNLRPHFQSYLLVLIGCILIFLLFVYADFFKITIWLAMVGVLAYVVYLALQHSKIERRKLLLLMVLNIFVIFYFACLMQVGSSLMLFVNSQHFEIAGYMIPSATFASLEPLFVILMAPIMTPLWGYLAKIDTLRPVIIRVILSLGLAGLSFELFSFSSTLGNIKEILIGIIIGNLLLGAGELCVGPALTSAVTYLAPKDLQGLFMGIWYFSIAVAGYLGSLLARLSISKTINQSESSYHMAFDKIGAMAFIACVVLIMLSPFLNRLVRTDN
ncbi:MAG: oligopeptide:H+ symporter [Gammaproteobacteria bacterium]|nr:oligopeptide:H+ symporter [Gammaproteobacteria bacterium]